MSIDRTITLHFGVIKDVKNMGHVVVSRFKLEVSYIATLEDLIQRLVKKGYKLNPWFGTGHDFRHRTQLLVTDPSLRGFLETPKQGYIHLTELPVTPVIDPEAAKTILVLNRERKQLMADLVNYNRELEEKINELKHHYEPVIQGIKDDLRRLDEEKLAAIHQTFGTDNPKLEDGVADVDAWLEKINM